MARAYAVAHPAKVERLVLVNTLARVGAAQLEEAERMIAPREGEPWHAEAVAALQAEEEGAYETSDDMARLWRAMAPMYFARWDDAARAFIEAGSGIGNVESLRLFNASTPDLTGELERIAAPTLVVGRRAGLRLRPGRRA